MGHWHLYVDESGDFAKDDTSVAVSGVLVAAAADGESLPGHEAATVRAAIEEAMRRARVPGAWPPHAQRLYRSHGDAGRRYVVEVRRVLRALRDTAVRAGTDVWGLVASESQSGDTRVQALRLGRDRYSVLLGLLVRRAVDTVVHVSPGEAHEVDLHVLNREVVVAAGCARHMTPFVARDIVVAMGAPPWWRRLTRDTRAGATAEMADGTTVRLRVADVPAYDAGVSPWLVLADAVACGTASALAPWSLDLSVALAQREDHAKLRHVCAAEKAGELAAPLATLAASGKAEAHIERAARHEASGPCGASRRWAREQAEGWAAEVS